MSIIQGLSDVDIPLPVANWGMILLPMLSNGICVCLISCTFLLFLCSLVATFSDKVYH